MQTGDDGMVTKVSRGDVLQMTRYTDKWCQKYWKRHAGLRKPQHPLTEVPSFCFDMLHGKVSCQRVEHRKTLQKVRYVKPLLLMCPTLAPMHNDKEEIARNTDKLLHLVTHNRKDTVTTCSRILLWDLAKCDNTPCEIIWRPLQGMDRYGHRTVWVQYEPFNGRTPRSRYMTTCCSA